MFHVASSDCDFSGKDGGAYQNVLMVSIDDLDNMINFDSNCLNNEPNFFKKHSCDDNKAILSFSQFKKDISSNLM
ncbi:hypothetical protein MG293_010085 [Ovis ammon polii]|uniref:Interleukin-7 n=1 Tax=Ovis ammon polii TaxID=230172 RepID=A0AAD4U9W0_OVIAM|nr:hypothetical protein MG293_010085 [Ovis ammon polii]